MNIDEYAKKILFSGDIDSKLQPIKLVKSYETFSPIRIPDIPTRDEKIAFSSERVGFPKNLKDINQRAKALHFFANHELLAIEMMAAAILAFPLDSVQQKRLLATIADEQKHFQLYVNRMEQFGAHFGDYPVNDFFWRQLVKVESFESFYALVALSLEQANLDFAAYYKKVFMDLGDEETANVLDIVLTDEERHVSFGVQHLFDSKDNKEIWNYYVSLLPENFTPARAKGIVFNYESRKKSGMSESFIEHMKNYTDDYKIINRKQWNKV